MSNSLIVLKMLSGVRWIVVI